MKRTISILSSIFFVLLMNVNTLNATDVVKHDNETTEVAKCDNSSKYTDLDHCKVYCMGVSRNNKIYISTDIERLVCIDSLSGMYYFVNDTRLDNKYKFFVNDQNGNLWGVTTQNRIIAFDGNTIVNEESNISSISFSENKMFVATSAGLVSYSYDNGNLTNRELNTRYNNFSLSCVNVTPRGNVVVGTYQGVMGDSIQTKSILSSKMVSIDDGVCDKLFVVNGQKIWNYNPRKKWQRMFANKQESKTKSSSHICEIIYVNQVGLLIATPEEIRFSRYGTEDAIQIITSQHEITSMVVTKGEHPSVVVGTTNGIFNFELSTLTGR